MPPAAIGQKARGGDRNQNGDDVLHAEVSGVKK
jgi:hypothetical protein